MDDHERIRELLKERFPTTYVVFQASSTRKNILAWELSADKLYNFEVDRLLVLSTLEGHETFPDCYTFFELIKLPKHAINDYRDLVLKFSKK